MLFRREAFRPLKKRLWTYARGARFAVVRPEGAPVAARRVRRAFFSAARFCLRAGPRSCQGLWGQRMPPSVKSVFLRFGAWPHRGERFSTKKAILRLRRPFAATDGLQNRHFEQAPTGVTERPVLSLFAAMPPRRRRTGPRITALCSLSSEERSVRPKKE